MKVVLQDFPEQLQRAREYWMNEFPQAILDKRVIFEPHNFFYEKPCTAPNTIHWFHTVIRE